jgi:hypothetical protein
MNRVSGKIGSGTQKRSTYLNSTFQMSGFQEATVILCDYVVGILPEVGKLTLIVCSGSPGRETSRRPTENCEDRSCGKLWLLVKETDKRYIYENVVRPSRGGHMAIYRVWMVKRTSLE